MVRDLHNHAADDGRREMTGMRTTPSASLFAGVGSVIDGNYVWHVFETPPIPVRDVR